MTKGIITVTVYRSRSKDPQQVFRWRAVAPNGRKVATSGEGYVKWQHAEKMAKALFPDAKIEVRV